MAAFMGTFQDDNNNSAPELPHLSGIWQIDSTPTEEQDCILSTSCRKLTQKKKVTFGGELTPELFDKRLPSNTPLRRGEMPVHPQITFSDSPPSALKQRAKTKTCLEEKKSPSDVTCNGSSPVKDHSDRTSSKLQRILEDDLGISPAGTQNVEEDRCYPISINFEIESPLSECKFGPDNRKCHNKNDDYPCKVLEVKIEELTETLPFPISSSGHPRKRKNAKKCTATVRRSLTKKKPDSKKPLEIQPDIDKSIPAIIMLESTELEAESMVESDMNHLPSTEMSKTDDVYLSQKKPDYSSNGGVQTNFNGHPCPNIENLSEQRDEIEDKNVCYKALHADVILNPTTKSQKTRKGDHESTKEEPRRSSRIKSNVKNISKNSTATKGKCKQKFKKSLYGKREYASKKPLLSPIAEVLDIWSESTDFSNSEGMLECETPKRTSLIHLEGIDRGRRHSMSKSESLANGWTPGCSLRKSVVQKPQGRRRPRKGAVHCFEKEQKIQSDIESETQKGNTGDHRLVPRRLNQFDYNLKCDNSQLPSLCENKKDMAFEVKWTDNVAKDVRKGKSLIKIKSKPFSKLPVLMKSSQQGITDTQSPSEGQCEMETGHEEYFEIINTDDNGGAGSLLESESNVLEVVNERREETEPNEMEKLIPIGASASEKSQETRSESVTGDITVFNENIISPPEAREEFRSRSSRRQSKLFHAIDLPYVTQSEQVLKFNGCYVVNAGDENEEKDENLSGRKKRRKRLSWKGIAEPTVPYQIGDEVDTANCESLPFNFADHCFLEQINTSMLEAVNQPETCIKHSDCALQNTKSKKKVRRSSRLSGCMNREGLRWIEVTSPQHLEKRNKSTTMRRRSFGLIESECNISNPEDIDGKIAFQARMRKLRRRSLSCNRERAFELEEPLRKSIVLD
ncbi:cell division cycle-associated protein 2 [Leucoraja erinacea]|uniref:cell division cycle-associated protein 2 n=1 Tax=Leucoraja erinaceus TaxID=7782 RepID=UPI0024576210|nr:cell division cycle-associated protein 2 [Leucoraja erinacea]